MYIKIFQKVSIACVIGASFLSISPTMAQTQEKYHCGMSDNGVPTTYANTATGKKISIIRWEKPWGEDITPEMRCQEVSENFQEAYADGLLKYLSPGYMSGYPVVCATEEFGGGCDKMLFTLRKNDNPEEAIESLLSIGYQVKSPLVQDNGEVKKYYSIEQLETILEAEN